MTGVVVWITGMPSAGKSTLAEAVHQRLLGAGRLVCVLDGDAVRAALVPAPGYSDSNRRDFYRTLANLAGLLARQEMIVLVAATAHRAEYREIARQEAPRFIEVFVDVPLEEVQRRDAKGLYAAARAGQTQDLPGADLQYEPPASPDVIAAGGRDEQAVARLVALLGSG